MMFFSQLSLLLLNLVLALNGTVNASDSAFDPSSDPVLKAGRTLINSWEENGNAYSIYGYGTYQNVTTVAAPPPWASDDEIASAVIQNITTTEWSHGTTLEVIGFDQPVFNESLSVEERDLEARACKRSCVTTNSYYWGSETTGGTWYTNWKRTDAIAYNGGVVQFCNDIILSPTFSGSIGIGIGIISASLGISPDGVSSHGYCYGCVSRTTGDKCSRLWYQARMNWRQGNLWRHETRYDNGLNQCSICSGEYDRNVLIGNIHSDWAYQVNGLPLITPGCSPCSD